MRAIRELARRLISVLRVILDEVLVWQHNRTVEGGGQAAMAPSDHHAADDNLTKSPKLSTK